MSPQGHLDAKVRAVGNNVTPETIRAMWELYRPVQDAVVRVPSTVRSDLVYGPDPRHRLDVRVPVRPSGVDDALRPVLLFVHGGGFVGGDKAVPGFPYYAHVAEWAVAQGWVGVTMTYRLAPADPWPAGGEDVAAAVAWLRDHAAEHGGDPGRIVVMGHSAGAAHVASYVADTASAGPSPVAGAVLCSGIYDLGTAERNDLLHAYFGSDPDRYPERSPLPGLLASPVPTLVTVAEFDPPDFQTQAAGYVAARFRQDGHVPPFLWVQGHNHISGIVHLGTDDTVMAAGIARFVGRAVTPVALGSS